MIGISEGTRRFNFRRSMGGVVLAVIIAMGILLLFIRADFHELARTLLRANPWFVVLAISLYFLEVGIWTGRWKAALRAVDYDIGLASLYLIGHGGKFVTNVTPIMKAGGDPFRAYFAKKTHGLPYDLGFGTLLAESVVSIPVFLSFLTAGLVAWLYLNSSLWLVFVIGLLMGVAIVFFLPFIRWLIERETARDHLVSLINWIRSHLGMTHDSGYVTKSLKNFYRSTQFVIEHRKAAISMAILTFFLYSVTVIRFYVIFLALGLHVAWYIPLLGATVPFLLGAIPFSPGGLVFVEGGMMGLFIFLGIPSTPTASVSTTAASVVVIERSISYFISTLVGAVAASYLGLKIWKH